MSCFFCGDESTHFGINLNKKTYSCWVCGKSGKIEYLVKRIERCSWGKVKKIIEQDFSENIEEVIERNRYEATKRGKDRKIIKGNILPESFKKVLTKRQKNYLIERNFNPRRLIKKYKIGSVDRFDRYKFRIIIPFYYNGKVVNFTTLGVGGGYLHCSNKNAIMDMGNILYNIDNAGKNVAISEGVTDVWRVGNSCLGIIGVQFTTEQIRLLARMNVKRILTLFDADATERGEQLALSLHSLVGNRIEIYHGKIKHGDPDKLGDKELSMIRQFINS